MGIAPAIKLGYNGSVGPESHICSQGAHEMTDIRIPVRPAKAAPKSKHATHAFKYATEGYNSRSVLVINNAGGGFKVPARMPKF